MIAAVGRRALLVLLAILQTISQPPAQNLKIVGVEITAIATKTPTPTITVTPTQSIYEARNWATITPTRTPWPRTLPCDPEYLKIVSDGDDHLWMFEQWTLHWWTWVERYREWGWHNIPSEIALAIIMHESRGNPNARSVCGAIGVMQIVPSAHGRTEAELWQSSKNIQVGLDYLENLTWLAAEFVGEISELSYRPEKYVILPGAENLDWWYGDAGQATLGMYQCGPNGLKNDDYDCGWLGGYIYADDVLNCWVPWVRDMLSLIQPEPKKPVWSEKLEILLERIL